MSTEHRTAGDPDAAEVLWTDLTPRQIADVVPRKGTAISPPVAREWLQEAGLSLRKIHKVLAGGESPHRDAQFQRIAAPGPNMRARATRSCPWIRRPKSASGNCSGKGVCGARRRSGRSITTSRLGHRGLIPHGISDPGRNRAHVDVGPSHDTRSFACDSVRWYWQRIGRQCDPKATSILLLCDGGGSNSASHDIFRHDLQELVSDLGLEIRAAHYPSYCSKYNPIERRVFPHLTRACQGLLFDALDTVVRLMRHTATETGLGTTVNVMRRACQTGREVAKDFKDHMTIVFDKLLPKWNYRAIPQ